ncbi:MAG: AAA family ATPase, partial [Alistipes sp.]|nr:AAA family ATPase [Alistipes sp.]
MAKLKRTFFCTSCGYETPKWLGKCPACSEWNTITEHVVAKESSSVASRLTSVPRVEPRKVQDIEEHTTVRVDVGIAEVNRVLGGGMVPGSLILLGGEPGIGKSTLSLQLALTENGLRTLYVSGEESAEQIKMRAMRLGIRN